jgi:hypothetical protein
VRTTVRQRLGERPGHYNLTGLTDLNLIVVVDGTDNVLIDNVAQVIDLAAWRASHTIARS